MSLIGRIWMALAGVIATTMSVLAVLAILQHDALLSQLIRQRLAVTVEATARPFRSVVELGLPVSMMRNKRALLERALESDPAIRGVVLFSPAGIIVERTGIYAPARVPRDVLEVQAREASERWGIETAGELISGASIRNDAGEPIAGIFAVYPKAELATRSRAVARSIGWAALVITLLFAGLAYLAVRMRVGGVTAALGRIEQALGQLEGTPAAPSTEPPAAATGRTGRASIALAIESLSERLDAASARYRRVLLALGMAEPRGLAPLSGPRETLLVGLPERTATRRVARSLTPIVLALSLGSAVLLGAVAYLSINDSFRPELERRTQLIGAIASADIQRSVEAGVPLTALAGAAEYLEHLRADFPEISYFAVLGDRPVLEVGDRPDPQRSPSAVFPIAVAGKTIGAVVTGNDADYAARQFLDLVIDLVVVLLVIVLFCFELIVVMMSQSISGPLDRLLHLTELQAAGDFSKRLVVHGRGLIDRLGQRLSERAEQLNAAVAQRYRAGDAPPGCQGPVSKTGTSIAGQPPALLRFCSLTDVRLPLFLFAMADELPLSFFSLFARAQENPFPWLGEGLAIGLPLATYLGAALLGAPIARPLGKRLGYRQLFVCAALSTFAAKIGLYFAQGIGEVVLYSGINGLAFVLASLACQDYVLDMLPKADRSRSISLFRATLFSGVFAATALGGILADRLGQRPVFAICALLSIIAAVLLWRMVPPTRRAHRAAAATDDTPEPISFNVLAPMRSAAFAAVALGSVIPLAIIDHVFISYLLTLRMDAAGASISEIARVMMYFFLAMIVGGYAQHRLPSGLAAPGLLLVFCSVVAGTALLASSLLPAIWLTTLAAVACGAALGLAGGPQTALVMDAAEGPLRDLGTSAVLGTIRVIERGGAIAGLVLVGWLADALGYAGAVGLIGILVLAGAGLFILLRLLASHGAMSGRSA
ncbi:MFS transporter [Pseudomonas zhanjiangensis]|uniref:MFS transporter n=1 Tax=Pseudomonas zhanjiangensis TaxID=3239015 RepID=A0ABV3YNX0_9PSED